METSIKKDSKIIGLIIGILVPLAIFYAYYYFTLSASLSFKEALYKFKTSNQFLTAISTVLILANALIFGLLIHFRKMNTAIGVFIPTVIIGVCALTYKFLT